MASTVDNTTEAVSNLTMKTEGTMSKEYVPKTPCLFDSEVQTVLPWGSDHRGGGNPFEIEISLYTWHKNGFFPVDFNICIC
ncbi:hypothetical protein L3X38_001566 [Prunus dulcis]|uniref:Uncharacterized protein n=1 Tax=Prunus dulcis TaxID=3755 RepID=A0AAD4WTS6_PRUDU|nr:hypothetical protein L3X38_001566 [Prunus dulcis]